MIQLITDPADASSIHAYAMAVDPGWRCAAPALARGDVERTYPRLAAVEGFITRADATVIVSRQNTHTPLRGYLIVVDDRGPDGKRGGCQGRWVGVSPPRPHMVEVATEMLAAAADIYGWVWGRVEHQLLHDILRDDIPDGSELRVDRQVLTYRAPA